MEFSFEIPNWLLTCTNELASNSSIVVIGIIIFNIYSIIAISYRDNMFTTSLIDKVILVVVTTTWLTSIISLIFIFIFAFVFISNIKILLSLIVIFIGYLLFSIICIKEITAYINEEKAKQKRLVEKISSAPSKRKK